MTERSENINVMNITELETKSREDLINLAKEMNLSNYSTLKNRTW